MGGRWSVPYQIPSYRIFVRGLLPLPIQGAGGKGHPKRGTKRVSSEAVHNTIKKTFFRKEDSFLGGETVNKGDPRLDQHFAS